MDRDTNDPRKPQPLARCWDELYVAGHELCKRPGDIRRAGEIVGQLQRAFELPYTLEERVIAVFLDGLAAVLPDDETGEPTP